MCNEEEREDSGKDEEMQQENGLDVDQRDRSFLKSHSFHFCNSFVDKSEETRNEIIFTLKIEYGSKLDESFGQFCGPKV